jgi:hypothetical protein
VDTPEAAVVAVEAGAAVVAEEEAAVAEEAGATVVVAINKGRRGMKP